MKMKNMKVIQQAGNFVSSTYAEQQGDIEIKTR